MCIYGYCRISRRSQRIERQERNILNAYPNAHIIKETFTGTKIEGRKELDKLLKVIKSGDTIVFDFSVPVPATIELPNGKCYELKEGEHHDEILL